eukprot:471799_1
MATEVEGAATYSEGEGHDDNSDFMSWLKGKNVTQNMVNKLVNGGVDSIEMLKAMQDEELNEVAKSLNLNVLEKARLKVLCSQIPDNDLQVTSDSAEREAMKKMNEKLKLIEESMTDIKNAKKNINYEIIQCKEIINKTIDNTICTLNKRREKLLNELNKIATKKTNEFNSKYKSLNTDLEASKNVVKTCSNMLRKPIDLNKVEERKTNILKMAQKVYNIDIINKIMISEYKITTYFKE